MKTTMTSLVRTTGNNNPKFSVHYMAYSIVAKSMVTTVDDDEIKNHSDFIFIKLCFDGDNCIRNA